ncbi:carbamoyltransferase N-terminal domain-containing protein [Bradyrhizobium sp. USDA 3364]
MVRGAAVCLVWDGGTFALLYCMRICAGGPDFSNVCSRRLCTSTGACITSNRISRRPPQIGRPRSCHKLMAYIELGAADENIVAVLQELYEERFAANTELALRHRAGINNVTRSVFIRLYTPSSKRARLV